MTPASRGRRVVRHSDSSNSASRVPQDALRLPEKALADALVAAYFAFVNPGFPVVDEDRFMAQYTTNDPNNPVSTLLLQAVLLVGAHVTCQGRQRAAVKSVFLKRAKTLIDRRQEPNSTVVVQAALLLAWQVDGSSDVSADAYYWIGTAAIIATGMGMHRDEDNTYEKRTWRRVFWLLFQWDTLVSMQCGRPQALHIEECDVQPLQPSDFDECGAKVNAGFVIQMTDLCVIISESLRNHSVSKTDPSHLRQVIQDADEALAQWRLHLPEEFGLRQGSMIDAFPCMLHLAYSTVLMLLHTPSPHLNAGIDFESSQVIRQEDAEISSAAAHNMRNALSALPQRDSMKLLWSSSIHSMSMAMMQFSIEVRLLNDPSLAESSLTRVDFMLFTLGEVAQYWSQAIPVRRRYENWRRMHGATQPIRRSPPTDDRPSWQREPAKQHPPAGDEVKCEVDVGREADESLQTSTDAEYERPDMKQLFPSGFPDQITAPFEFPWQEWLQICLREPNLALGSTSSHDSGT